ncbi:anti-sigma factor family protein [Yoonia sp.]|uniref:anti-sigma factor family protein n=1 Tax=Yoonia sp. TaxID=2212373 RepID=UPI003918A4D9
MTRTNEVSDDMLMALADGELNDTVAQRLYRRIEADPDLAARYADFVETRALMQVAFPPEPVPERLIAAVVQAGAPQHKVVPMRRRSVGAPVWGMALAASLVLAVGGFLAGRSTVPVTAATDEIGAMTASLPTGDEIQLPDGTMARVLASYETDLGLCRMIAQDSLRHVTCRDAATDGWALALTVQGAEADRFLAASDIGVGLIDQLLDEIGAGPALTADAERHALSE